MERNGTASTLNAADDVSNVSLDLGLKGFFAITP